MTSLFDIYKEGDIQNVYEEIGYDFERRVVNNLRKQKILPEEKKWYITTDFRNMREWHISTWQKDYSMDGVFVKREYVDNDEEPDVHRMKGRLFITKYGNEVDPSFQFEYNFATFQFTIDLATVKKIIEDAIEVDIF